MIHKQILDKIRQQNCGNCAINFESYSDQPDEEIYRRFFSNIRISEHGIRGLKLTPLGLAVMQNCFANWVLKMPKYFVIMPKHLIYFDQTCTMPWFLNNKVLVLFEAELAMRAKLVGNLDHLLTAFAKVDS